MNTLQNYRLTPITEKLAIVGMSAILHESELENVHNSVMFEESPITQFNNTHQPCNDSNVISKKTYNPENRIIRAISLALHNAGLSQQKFNESCICLVLFGQFDNIERIIEKFSLTGHIYQLSNTDDTLSNALDLSREYLFSQKADAVLVATEENAIVFRTLTRVMQSNQHIFAIVESYYSNSMNGSPSICIRDACQRSMEAAGIEYSSIGYLEFSTHFLDYPESHEIVGLADAFPSSVSNLTCAAGNLQMIDNDCQAAGQINKLIKTALCLYHRQIPIMGGWNAPHHPSLWQKTPFYIALENRAWFLKPFQNRRYASVNLIHRNNHCTHIILSESSQKIERTNNNFAKNGSCMFLVTAQSIDEIFSQLHTLKQSIDTVSNINKIARHTYELYLNRQNSKWTICLLGKNQQELYREIEYALTTIGKRFEKGCEWQTPLGSYATPNPLGANHNIAFVYPGAFNSYLGAGQELFNLFPCLFEYFSQITNDPGLILREHLLYPRSRQALDAKQKIALEKQLKSDPIAMLTSGTALSFLYTYILKDLFDIRPASAFGYSLGENSMMFASGVWRNGDEVNACLENSPLFHTRLAGPQNAVREHWGLPQMPDDYSSDDFWTSYVVMVKPEDIISVLKSQQFVYLTHINTPHQVVIAGKKNNCQHLIQFLGNPMHLQTSFNYALHCDAIRSEREMLTQLHSWDIENAPETRLYSAAHYRQLTIDRSSIADSLGKMLCECIDFPRLVNKVYQDGAHIFIEVGAGSNCARWISDSLGQSPHLALSINRPGVDDHTSIMRLLAKLVSHAIPLNLEPVYKS